MATTNSFDFHLGHSPRSLERHEGGGVTLQSSPEQDWWRTPPPAQVDRMEGPFWCRAISSTAPRWRFGAWITAEYKTQYDQAEVLLYAGGKGEAQPHWIKAGVEMEHGQTFLADFTTSPSPSPITAKDSVYIQLTRNTTDIGDTIVIKYAIARDLADPASTVPDEKALIQIREVPAFNVDPGSGRRIERDQWFVGVMTCGPKNKVGTEARFEGFHYAEF